MKTFLHELRYQQLVFWRSREAAVFIFIFPLLLFLLLSSVYTGKIYEYLSSGRPVLGIVDPGPGAALIQSSRAGVVIAPGDEKGVAKAILAWLRAWRAPMALRGSTQMPRGVKRGGKRALSSWR